jgi:membrane protease YdiL (CAAX protease family)
LSTRARDIRRFIEKYQILLFFLFSTLLGYWPWYILGEPGWFMLGMPLTGIVLVGITQGKEGIKEQLKSAVRVKAKPGHYLGILGILISISLLTLFISYILFGDVPSLKMIRTEPQLIPLLFLGILLGGPIFEEVFGLRGYALPVLLKTKSPLISSIIVGTYFGAWHLAEFFRPGSSQYAIGLEYYPLFILAEIGFSTIMTWFYIRSNKNLFLSGVFFHWMMNCTSVIFLTDITLTEIESFPKVNPHYFILQTAIILLIAAVFIVKGKMH